MSGDETTGAMVEGEDTSLLIVDDDKPFLTRLARAMETRGFVVETADSVKRLCCGSGEGEARVDGTVVDGGVVSGEYLGMCQRCSAT